jgi:hypothetical protein
MTQPERCWMEYLQKASSDIGFTAKPGEVYWDRPDQASSFHETLFEMFSYLLQAISEKGVQRKVSCHDY